MTLRAALALAMAASACLTWAQPLPAQGEPEAPGAAAPAEPAPAPKENPFKPFDRAAFVAAARAAGASDQQITQFEEKVAAGEPAGVAGDALLRAMSKPYDEAAGQAEQGDPAAALSLAKLLAEAPHALLRAHARYHLARVFLDADDPLQAAEILSDYLREDRNRTALDPEAFYFYGWALSRIPDREMAVAVLKTFLQWFPDAPERFVASATQQVAELEAQFESPLHDIADVMLFVERRIRKTDTGKDTQDRQQQIIAQLEKIIEEMEKREQQSSGGPSGNGQSSSPAMNSALPQGASRIGSLDKVRGVADRWGQMKDRDREAIESDLQTKLPEAYRKMLAEYYKKLTTAK